MCSPSNRTSDSATDWTTMRSEVIGDFQEPYGAVLGMDMLYLQYDPRLGRSSLQPGLITSAKGSFPPNKGARVIDKSYRHDCLNLGETPEYAAYVAPALS